LAAKTACASAVISGAMMTSANWPEMASAAALSMATLSAMMPPKAEMGSVLKALR